MKLENLWKKDKKVMKGKIIKSEIQGEAPYFTIKTSQGDIEATPHSGWAHYEVGDIVKVETYKGRIFGFDYIQINNCLFMRKF